MTACLADAVGIVSAATATAALAIEVGTGGLGTPRSVVLGGVAVGTGMYASAGACLYDGEGTCAVSVIATGLSAAAPGAGVLKAIGVAGRDAEIAWRRTIEFMATPFSLTGPLLWREENLPR